MQTVKKSGYQKSCRFLFRRKQKSGSSFDEPHCLLVPKAGLEPARGETRLILSQVRLPIPPLRHFSWFLLTCYCRSEQLLLYRYGEEMSTPFLKNF